MLQFSETATICSTEHQSFRENCIGCAHIRDIWYNYIDQIGFVDIERVSPNAQNSIAKLLNLNAFQSQDTYQNRLNYYIWAKHSIPKVKTEYETDRIIWEYHAEGLSIRQIEKIIGLHNSRVCRKIKKIRKFLGSST